MTTTEPRTDLLGIITGSIHNILATNVTLRRGDDPLAILTPRTGCRTKANDLRPKITGAFGQGLG